VEQSPLAEEQLHHLGVALPGGQVEGRQAALVALVHHPRVRGGLQEPVAGIDPPVPDGGKGGWMRMRMTCLPGVEEGTAM